MPRQMGVQYPGALYRAMSLGDQRDDIVLDAVDWHGCVQNLAQACLRAGWQVRALDDRNAPRL